MSKTTTHTTRRTEALGGPARHRYMSKAWREAYGATIATDEVRLLQGFRVLDRETQELIAATMTELVVATAAAADRNERRQPSIVVALRRALRTIGKHDAHDLDNLRVWAREADLAARGGLPVQIPTGAR